MENYTLPYEYSKVMEHDKWLKEIPYLSFKSDWQIHISPPFAGAVVRFRVKKETADVSIYLDCYDRLGCYGEPYWEVYPHDGDVFRCDLKDTESLMKAIEKSIDEQLSVKSDCN